MPRNDLFYIGVSKSELNRLTPKLKHMLDGIQKGQEPRYLTTFYEKLVKAKEKAQR